MRYDGWDVILFSNTSPAPIQEFRTTCFDNLDDYGREIPTLRSYISSIAPATPIRISLHNWELPYTPSAAVQSRQRSGEKIVLTVEIVIDGAQAFYSSFDTSCKWPQEIAYQHRSQNASKQIVSQTTPRLKFPPFNAEILMHKSWSTRGRDNTISVTLSEQLVRNRSPRIDGELGFANPIVCFAFQHAPRTVLEQAGIAYPVRNPLYLPSSHQQVMLSSHVPPSYPQHAKYRRLGPQVPLHPSPETGTVFGRPPLKDLRNKQHYQLPPISDHNRVVEQRGGGGHAAVHDDFSRSFIDIDEDVSMSTWSTAPSISDFVVNSNMPGHSHMHTRRMDTIPAWTPNLSQRAHQTLPEQNDPRSRKGKDVSIVVSLGEEQFERTAETNSPHKKSHELLPEPDTRHRDQTSRPLAAQASTPTFTRPTLATQGRTSSYVDPHNVSKVPSLEKSHTIATPKNQSPVIYHPSYSSDKENRNPSQPWLPATSSHANLAPTPNMFAQGTLSWKPDVHMKDASSIFPNLSEYDSAQSVPTKVHSAHAPSGLGGIKSRKEGMAIEPSRLSDHDIRHDQSLLPNIGNEATDTRKFDTNSSDKDSHCATATHAVEVIDVDAINPKTPNGTEELPYFRPYHKHGMSSVDSTMRIERQLYSALGEELGGFDQQMDTTDMGPELAQALTGTAVHTDFIDRPLESSESDPTVKRKRQGTFGGERGRSPTNKKEKSRQAEVEDEDDAEGGMLH